METVVVIQSEEFVHGFYETDNVNQFVVDCLQDKETIGCVLIKEFETIQEKNAYLQGFEDCEGWTKNYLIEDAEARKIASFVKASQKND